MKNLTKMVGLASIVLATSCATMTPAQKTALWGNALTIAGSVTLPNSNNPEGDRARQILSTAGTVVTNQAMMQHDLEYANAGRSEIVINNNPPNYQNGNSQNYSNQNQNSSDNSTYDSRNVNRPTPEGFFMYKNFADKNNNGIANWEDFIDLNKPVYDLRDLNSLQFAFYGGGKSEYGAVNLNLKIYDLNEGKVINSFDELCKTWKIQNFTCESKYFPKSGKYKAVLNIGSFKTSSLDFEVIK
jgi:hypothetical protein